MNDISRFWHALELERPPGGKLLRAFVERLYPVFVPLHPLFRDVATQNTAVSTSEFPQQPVAEVGAGIVTSVVYAALTNLGLQPLVSNVGGQLGDKLLDCRPTERVGW
jgi:hypothetical protein